MRRAVLFAVVGVLSLTAGDWLNRGGDAQHSGWQRRGKSIGVANAGEIKLLWKRTLEGGLTAPVMLGPIVTHRGIKELVFVGAAPDNIYAVDADLGRVFWKRHIESPAAGPCGAGLTATPAMAPAPPGPRAREDDDEGHTPMRPFYFVASDGVLHTIRPADGIDMAPARNFVPAHANLSALTFADGFVYATTSNGCGSVPDGVWGIDTADAKAKAGFVTGKATGGVSVGAGGTVYAARDGGILALAAGTLKEKASYRVSMNGDAPIEFPWKGRTMLAVAGGAGDVTLLDAGKVASRHVGAAIHGLATWIDASGTRWIYAAVDKKIVALRVRDTDGALAPGWVSSDLGLCMAPVIANGVVFALARSVLYALDARTGTQLYASGDAITPFADSSALAVANGHITFGTSDGTLYCFGLPIEIY
jgi:outer membrane protein assembly factor BamB